MMHLGSELASVDDVNDQVFKFANGFDLKCFLQLIV